MDYDIIYDGHRCIEKSKRKMQRVVVGTGAPPRLSLRHGKRGIVRSHFGGTTRAYGGKMRLALRLSQSVSFAREFSAGKKTSPVFRRSGFSNRYRDERHILFREAKIDIRPNFPAAV